MLRKGLEWTVYDSYMSFEEVSAPGTPPSNQIRIYAKDKSSVSALYYKNDAGTEREIGNVFGSGTANRLAYWSDSATLAANAALTQNRLITADSNGLPASIAALTQGHVLFADANGLPTGETNLFWDATNDRLGIGTATPGTQVDISGAGKLRIKQGAASAPASGKGLEIGVQSSDEHAIIINFDRDGAAYKPLDIYGSVISLGISGNLRLVLDASDHLTLGGGATASELRLLEPSGSGTNYTAFKCPALAANVTYTLPVNDGDASQVLSTDGAGVLSWATAGSGTPGGADTQVQFNNAGAFGGSADLIWDGTDLALGSTKRFRMQGQNRTRYLNSMAVAQEDDVQTISNTTWTLVAFNDADLFDTDTLHDTVTNNSRVLARLAGKYLAFGYIIWAANSTGGRNTRIEKNAAGVVTGGTFVTGVELSASLGTNTQLHCVGLVDMAANDYIEIFVRQDSGGNLDIGGLADNDMKLGLVYLGE